MYLSAFLIRESEQYITKILDRDKFSLGSQKGKTPLSQYFLKFISTKLGLRLLDVLRIQKRNSRAFSCLKNVRDYRWTSQIKI